MDLTELLKTAADPSLIASAKEANLLLAQLQAHVSDLRPLGSELELENDIARDKLYNELKAQGKTEKYIDNQYRITELYREWKRKTWLLADVRAVKRNLERHADLLLDQEKYSRKYENQIRQYW